MLAIEIKLLTGRFHATPWGHHVNEGVPEWPPSPWRFLRTLLALWYQHMDGAKLQLFEGLLSKLTALPAFYLPQATVGNTQHYIPAGSKQSLVFDTFTLIDKEKPLFMIWEGIDLSAEEEDLLSRLLSNLTYFGRAESWAEARIASQYPIANCFPLEGNKKDGELVRLLCAENGQDLIKNLQFDTQDQRQQGVLDPEGSIWIDYLRPFDAFSVTYRRQPVARKAKVNVVRFALYGKPLPRIVDALAVGELARLSAMARYGRMNNGTQSPTLSGKDEEGQALRDHQHAYYLPTDEDRDGTLDHLTVYSPRGFNISELDAVLSMRALNPGESKPTINLMLLGMASAQDITALPFSRSDTWTSITPFVLGRFPKYFRTGQPKLRENGWQVDGPIDQVHREWNLRRQLDPDLPEVLSVEPLAFCSLQKRKISWTSFRLWRKWGRGTKTPGLAYGFRLRFARPVHGPITLGYASHFGLGMFFPEREERNG
jgi:CRISPR-associated protein Csb2